MLKNKISLLIRRYQVYLERGKPIPANTKQSQDASIVARSIVAIIAQDADSFIRREYSENGEW